MLSQNRFKLSRHLRGFKDIFIDLYGSAQIKPSNSVPLHASVNSVKNCDKRSTNCGGLS